VKLVGSASGSSPEAVVEKAVQRIMTGLSESKVAVEDKGDLLDDGRCRSFKFEGLQSSH
jgi:hypothetical protein